MKKRLMIIGIIIILLTVRLSGCNEDNNTVQSDEDKFIGTWNNSIIYNNTTMSVSYVFSLNKTFEIISSYIDEVYTVSGTWNLVDNMLVTTLEGQNTTANDYKFFSNNTKLILIYNSGNTVVFTKQ